jgi:hypothetical protein
MSYRPGRDAISARPQRKLDEILLAIPGTDNSLLTLEHASDNELHAVGHQRRSIRQATLGPVAYR